MVAHLHGESEFAGAFSTWAIEQIDNRLASMALEYAGDAEAILQILSFKGGSLDTLLQDIENLYGQEKICQRVYARAKLLLWTNQLPQ